MSQAWNSASIRELFEMPFMDLLLRAQTTHREHFTANTMELCTLLSVKTGACPEDCAYCPQSGHYATGLEKEKLFSVEEVMKEARLAKQNGAQRFCMGAAWRSPPKKLLPRVVEMIKAVKELGLETCVTLGMLDADDASELKKAGLDYYNHNLDTSPEYYKHIISTRTYEDRLETLQHVSDAGINVCCGGIVGLGETRDDRVEFLHALAKLPHAPKTIPINMLVRVKGTPLENAAPLESFEFIRTIAAARIIFPQSTVRLSAGRESMSAETQALCFFAGANSLFLGDKLLVTPNPSKNQDFTLLQQLGITTHTEASAAC